MKHILHIYILIERSKEKKLGGLWVELWAAPVGLAEHSRTYTRLCIPYIPSFCIRYKNVHPSPMHPLHVELL
jgi:hypothetical protein